MSASITLDRSVAPVGQSIHIGVTGTGFTAGGTVTVTFGGVAVPFDGGGVVSSTGAIADTFNIVAANLPAGAHTVSITDGTNTATSTITTSVWQTAAIRETQESVSHTAYGTY